MEMNKQQIIEQLNKHRLEINQFGIQRIALFGSYVKNNARNDSDIDIFVTFLTGSENYDNFIGLCFFLDRIFPGKKVEVVTEGGLSPYIESEVKRNAEYI